jgi:GNAT superfamily N-acetyltransferase
LKATYDYDAVQVLLLQDIPLHDPEAPMDVRSMGNDLHQLVTNIDNVGLQVDFKQSVDNYSNTSEFREQVIRGRRLRCIDEPDKLQSLIAVVPRPPEMYVSKHDRPLIVVGLGSVAITPDIIPQKIPIDPASPNVSLFVDAAHRKHGIAERIVKRSKEVIDELHNKLGWTAIRPENVGSQHLMRKHDFRWVGHGRLKDNVPRDYFRYDGRSKDIE